jgi:hypothetical protein
MEHESPSILTKEHEGIVEGPYIGKSTTKKVLCALL